MPELRTSPCRQRCRWRPAAVTFADLPLFRCLGCGSEWVRSEPWAPVDADGSRDPALVAEVAHRPARG